MNAFFIGLIFIVAVSFFIAIGILFLPLLFIFGWLFNLLLMFGFAIFAIWLLGKLIIFFWENLVHK